MRKTLKRCISLLGAVTLTLSGCATPHSAPLNPDQSISDTAEASYANLTVQTGGGELAISDNLFGLFLEDINFAVDAGLYTELVKNRSFEYGFLAAGEHLHGWTATAEAVSMDIAVENSLNENNPTYVKLTNTSDVPEGIFNPGYLDGMAVTAGESYTASVYIRGSTQAALSLESKDGAIYGEAGFTADSKDWRKYSVTLTPSESVSKDLRLVLRIGKGSVDVDMVSLMTQDGFMGLPIRKDLGEALQALQPSFIRFPGGCVIEGKSEESMYNWKDSIGNGIPYSINGDSAVGDAAARPQVIDIWNGNKLHPYYCTYGLGFYEYFQLCEALECMPIPVLNAGMTCQVQSPQYIVYPLSGEKFRQCVQDALDLVEFCRGGADSTWGAVRIAMGHEEPFTLKYIAIGNEQWQSEYHAHYEAFVLAFQDAAKKNPALYGDIELIVANGTASGSTEGWAYVDDYPDDITTLVDEHYYEAPSWFLANTRRYDGYDRGLSAKVFLGEYASQSNTMLSALAEAAYMTGLERNGDIVELVCYAPLLGNGTLNQWTPDMIFFSNDSLCLTPNYYVQQMFAANAGNTYLNTALEVHAESKENVLSGRVGLGSWQTSVAYDNLKVVSNADGAVLLEHNFSDDSGVDVHRGDWDIEDGRLVQFGTGAPADGNTGDAVYLGDTGWSDYTMTVEATILGGAEGFLIPVCVQNAQNNIFWNLGGWGNTVSCLQIVSGGSKSGQISGTVKNCRLEHGKTYNLKVVVSGNTVECYVDDVLYLTYTEQTPEPLYASTVRAENGDLILKLVNVTDAPIPVKLDLPLAGSATLTVLKSGSPSDVNTLQEPGKILPAESILEIAAGTVYDAPAYSLSVIRIPAV